MRKLKGFIIFLLFLAVLVAAAVVILRIGRQKTSAPDDVKPNLYRTTNMGGVHVFAARVGGKIILFDTGADPDARPIDALLRSFGAGRHDVKDIFLSHGHIDHIAGALSLPSARIHLGAGDVDLAAGKVSVEALLGKVISKLAPIPPLTRVSNPLQGKATIDVGDGKTVKAYPVPGHTRGSFAYLYDDVFFPGDIMIFKQGHLEPTPSLFDAHPEENKAAIRSLKAQLEGETIEFVCTPHGGCTPKGLGRIQLDELISRLGG